MRLEKALRAWGASDFEAVLKRELSQLATDQLPLQQGLASGNYVADTPISAMISSVVDLQDVIRVKAGIFYQGVIGGCSCTDDPTPASEINEYCEVQLDIDKITAVTAVTLIE
ncbi:MAG: hypothetical protein Q8L80_10120 [Gallionella sp.]|nr:hypothetical protein [Gallionella sp.]MDP1941345.1 hypothetical protein [Gallionella sp.]